MTKANVKSAKANVNATSKVEAKEMKKSEVIFRNSVAAIVAKRSTGSSKLDAIGTKVLYGIHEGKLQFAQGEDYDGFEGTLGKAQVCVYKQSKGKVNETVLEVAGMQIRGEFAARAYKMAFSSLNKKGRKSIEVDEVQAESVLDLLG